MDLVGVLPRGIQLQNFPELGGGVGEAVCVGKGSGESLTYGQGIGLELDGALEDLCSANRVAGILQRNRPLIENDGVGGLQGRCAFKSLGSTLPLPGSGSGVAKMDEAVKVTGAGARRGLQRRERRCGVCVGRGERGELEEVSGLAGIKSGGVAVSFCGELPILLERVDLGQIKVGD